MAELVDAFLGVGAADAYGDRGMGGVAGGLAFFGGGSGGRVDAAAELGGFAGVGLVVEAVDGLDPLYPMPAAWWPVLVP